MGLTERDMGLVDQPSLTLSAPTSWTLKAADDRAKASTAADAKEQKRLADQAKADAEFGEFRLTGAAIARPARPAGGGSWGLEAPSR